MGIPKIFDIQKYCIHDGDGIRTTVFFKGCPLTCSWCHNPESQNYYSEILHNREACTGCGACLEVCPEGAVSAVRGDHVTGANSVVRQDGGTSTAGQVNLDHSICSSCGACLDECLMNAREISGRQYTLAELIKELEKDKMFYEESSGGITLSGGEVMCQDIGYIEELVRRLHRKGYDIAVDTCGDVPYERFERILPYVTTFLYDIKLMDSELHRQYTGTGNERILDNLRKLSDRGARLCIRLPLIEGINADEAHVGAVIDYLDSGIHAATIHLLPYHNTGIHKYDKLGKEYPQQEMERPGEEKLQQFIYRFQEHGYHNVKIGG